MLATDANFQARRALIAPWLHEHRCYLCRMQYFSQSTHNQVPKESDRVGRDHPSNVYGKIGVEGHPKNHP